MNLKRRAIAGTMESSDTMIEIIPWEKSLEINLKSDVEKQYGNQILDLVKKVLAEDNIENACVNIIDKGALDFTISARLKTALYRASK
ncbi:MAG: citrate lyase acyl carrier protein [Tissierellales bacterium]|jgi:citrate lyase subunit gamma (acyl carrier protein)|nr:citrate lyase acyl carrier protein [Tissierellales bacterium]MBN2828519.1 citrate lyase acyl carrier protein [Tissierellales bacterium]